MKKWTALNLSPSTYTTQTEVAFSKKVFGRYFSDSEIVQKFTKVTEGKDKCSTQMSQHITWDSNSLGIHATLDWNQLQFTLLKPLATYKRGLYEYSLSYDLN